jgi:TIR domain
MYDVFISYTSGDRLWADRLFRDLKEWYPTLKIFWDRESIPPGVDFRQTIDNALRQSSHLAVLWSDAAKNSNEVTPEIATFQELAKAAAVKKRTIFYVPLQGKHGPLEDDQKVQGFVAFREKEVYEPATQDRGVSTLDAEPNQTEWKRMLRKIVETIRAQDEFQQVNLAIVAMNVNDRHHLPFLEKIIDTRIQFEPTLQEVLDVLGLDLKALKARYGPTAADWRPSGKQTIGDLMEELRTELNRELDLQGLSKYRFSWSGWEAFDLVGKASALKTHVEFDGLLTDFSAMPFVVVVDPISLFSFPVLNAFNMLLNYTHNEHGVIVSLSPIDMPLATGCLYQLIRGKCQTVLGPYFVPTIPSKRALVQCGVNIEEPTEVRRLVRRSLGEFFLARERNPLPSGA